MSITSRSISFESGSSKYVLPWTDPQREERSMAININVKKYFIALFSEGKQVVVFETDRHCWAGYVDGCGERQGMFGDIHYPHFGDAEEGEDGLVDVDGTLQVEDEFVVLVRGNDLPGALVDNGILPRTDVDTS